MSGENETVEEAQIATNETTDAAEGDDADFNSGFNGAPTATPGPEPEFKEDGQDQATATGEQQGDPQAGDGQPEVTPPPEFVQITKDQFDDLMKHAAEVDTLKTSLQQHSDKAFGKIGGIERILGELRSTPTGQPLKLSQEDFAGLRDQYPELAELLIQGMQPVLEKLPARGGSVDSEMIEKVVQERTATVRTEVIDSALDGVIGGDWREEVKSPKYVTWIATQPADIKALEASPSLRDASKLMRMFKAHRDAPAPVSVVPTPTPPKPSPQQRAIAAAVSPKGTGVSTVKPSEDDEFNAGFKSG